jgi:hypothetical protein
MGGLRRRAYREGKGHFLLREALMSEEMTLAFTARPVRLIRVCGRRARGHALRCLRVGIRTKANHLSR